MNYSLFLKKMNYSVWYGLLILLCTSNNSVVLADDVEDAQTLKRAQAIFGPDALNDANCADHYKTVARKYSNSIADILIKLLKDKVGQRIVDIWRNQDKLAVNDDFTFSIPLWSRDMVNTTILEGNAAGIACITDDNYKKIQDYHAAVLPALSDQLCNSLFALKAAPQDSSTTAPTAPLMVGQNTPAVFTA